MKKITIEHLIIAVLVILLAISYSRPNTYRYQSIDKYQVFDKKTGKYYDTTGELDVIEMAKKS